MLSHEEQRTLGHVGVTIDANERSVGASNVRQENSTTLAVNATVKPRNVAIIREDDVAAFATQMHAIGSDGEAVSVGFATRDETNPTEVTWVLTAHRDGAVGASRRFSEGLKLKDLLADAEDRLVSQLRRRVAIDANVDTIEALEVGHRSGAT